jgi:hypothetical protein
MSSPQGFRAAVTAETIVKASDAQLAAEGSSIANCFTQNIAYESGENQKHLIPFKVSEGRIMETSGVTLQVLTPSNMIAAQNHMPFVGNCKVFGRFLPLAELFTRPDLCDLPSGGHTLFDPGIGELFRDRLVADKCDYKVRCLYNDFADIPVANQRYWWWQERPTDLPLFFLSKELWNSNKSRDEITLGNMDHNGTLRPELVPVILEISENRSGYITGDLEIVPREIMLDIRYKHIEDTSGKLVKEILDARLVMSNFEAVKKYGNGDSCDSSKGDYISCTNRNRFYDFRVNYQHAKYIDMLTSLQLADDAYVTLFLSIGVVIVCISILIWFPVFLSITFRTGEQCRRCGGHLAVSERGCLKHRCTRPGVRSFVTRFVKPILLASVLIIIPATAISAWATLLLSPDTVFGDLMAELPADLRTESTGGFAIPKCFTQIRTNTYSDPYTCITKAELNGTRNARYAVTFWAITMMCLVALSSMFVFDIPALELSEWKETMKDKLASIKIKADRTAMIKEATQDINMKAGGDPSTNPISRKKSHLLFVGMTCAVIFLALMDILSLPTFKGTPFFVFGATVAVRLGRGPVYKTVNKLFNEELLVTPFLSAYQMLELTTPLTATNFVEYVACYMFVVYGDLATRIIHPWLATRFGEVPSDVATGKSKGSTNHDGPFLTHQKRQQVLMDLRQVYLSLGVVTMYPGVLTFLRVFQEEVSGISAAWHHVMFAAFMVPVYYICVMFTNDIVNRLFDLDIYRWLELAVCQTWDGDFSEKEDLGGSEAGAAPLTKHQRQHKHCLRTASPGSSIFFTKFRGVHPFAPTPWQSVQQAAFTAQYNFITLAFGIVVNGQTIALRMIFFNFKYLGSDKLVPPDVFGYIVPLLGVIVMFILIMIVQKISGKFKVEAPLKKNAVVKGGQTKSSRARAVLQEQVNTLVSGLDMDGLNVASDYVTKVKEAVSNALAMKQGKKENVLNEVSDGAWLGKRTTALPLFSRILQVLRVCLTLYHRMLRECIHAPPRSHTSH